ncbi:MAG: hypothetical protein MIO92_14180, partial [Methanosarcinaceae archaeon]|nr:hypothetical protein [Methanosarcinaceae archaeon]
RFPGCYTYVATDGYPFHPNHDANYSMPMGTENMWKAEEMCLHDNPVLGAIPVIAKVEKLENKSGEWKPVKDATVYFQLAEPYEFDKFPAFDNAVSPSQQLNCPPLRKTAMVKTTGADAPDETKGPHKHVKAALEKIAKTDGDPQVDNCPSAHGGKRGLDVYKNIFEYKVDFRTHKKWTDLEAADEKLRPGFHAEHGDDDRKRQVKGPFYPEIKEPADKTAHPHAVCAKTNEDGYAGVIFKPSTIGGERYRLRAYVGPDTIKGPGSDGKGISAASVETGTFVVWRNYRVSKVVHMPYGSMSETMLNQFKTGTVETDHRDNDHTTGYGKSPDADTYEYFKCALGFSKKNGTDTGYSTVDLAETGDPNCSYEGFFKILAYSFGELELDPGADSSTAISDADWKAALKAAKDFLKIPGANHDTVTAGTNNYTVDIDRLFVSNAAVQSSTSFALIPLMSLNDYNKNLGPSDELRKEIKKLSLSRWFSKAAKKRYNELLIELERLNAIKKIPTKTVAEANTIKPGANDIISDAFDTWFDRKILEPFAHHLVGQGFRPGLTMIQMPTISTWHACGTLGDYAIGLGYRVCIMNAGCDKYPYNHRQYYHPIYDENHARWYMRYRRDGMNTSLGKEDEYGYSALMAHEWGHCLFREHSPPDPDAGATTIHDDIADGFCVMSYCPMEGHFCGKCNLSLRGWRNINTLP